MWHSWKVGVLLALLYGRGCVSFSVVSTNAAPRVLAPSSTLHFAYVPIQEEEEGDEGSSKNRVQTKKKPLLPQVGDVVRFYDIDGGKADGQVLVGKITYIQKELGATSGSGWLVELLELEDTGDGYYAEYSSRRKRKALRNLADVAPIAASFVKAENAFKLPRTSVDGDGSPKVRAERYDWEEYAGPFTKVDETVVEADSVVYQTLKGRVLRFVALAGLAGTVVADLVKGTEDAAIYFAGALASVLYVFLLSVKTDTIASPEAKLGKNVSNIRFVLPLFVLVGVALYNQSRGDANPVKGQGNFDLVTAEQFAAATIGFLTYRLPLFAIQIQDAFKGDGDTMELPGSAGVALKLVQDASAQEKEVSLDRLATVFLVSGPQATGRSALVKKLIEQSDGRLVAAPVVDRRADPVNFERIEQRDEFLSISEERFGYTKEGILTAAKNTGSDSVLVVDADVEFAKRLTAIAGLRLVGVWVGLDSVDEFERRLEAQIDAGEIELPEDETRESVVRARIKEIVKEVEYGISSGVFEFTILNTDDDTSLKQLQEAAQYCFK